MTIETRPTIGQLWDWLSEVPDPEIPMVSVVDLGIVREVEWVESGHGLQCVVTVTPTYSGCPATEVINRSIEQTLRDHGVADVRLTNRISPAWTTEWITEAGKRKLRASGIAPPVSRPAGSSIIDISGLRRRLAPEPTVVCPHCGSDKTSLTSQFGSTACKALYRCDDCLEPFHYFKCH